MLDSNGEPVNAVYGFAEFLCNLFDRDQPSHIAIAFDESLTTSFRNEIYPQYKANREPAPPDLKAQMESCRQLVKALGLASLTSDCYEADDLIGSVADKMRVHGFSMVFVTADKDFSQLLLEGDILFDFARNRRLDCQSAEKHFGVRPEQMIDFLALAGDQVDNVPGVKGVGNKTAISLLKHFGTLDSIYANLEEIPSLSLRGAKRIQNLLHTQREQAYMSKRLVKIAIDAPVEDEAKTFACKQTETSMLDLLCRELNIGSRLGNRLKLIASNSI